MSKLPQRQKDVLLYRDSKHDLRTIKALERKGLVRISAFSRGRRYQLTHAGNQWVEAYASAGR